MSILTSIDGIPLFSSIQEALDWAASKGLQGYHTHIHNNQVGYMGGFDHNNAVTGSEESDPDMPTYITPTTTQSSSPSSNSGGSSGGTGGGY